MVPVSFGLLMAYPIREIFLRLVHARGFWAFYFPLDVTLAFSALTAGTALAFNLPHPGLILTLVGYFGLLFAVHKTRNSALGIAFEGAAYPHKILRVMTTATTVPMGPTGWRRPG